MRAQLVLVLVLALAGCGARPPPLRGSTLVLDHKDSSVPPPNHHAWRIELRPDGSGSIRYWPDYPGPGVVPLDRDFTAADPQREALLQAMAAAGVTDRRWRAAYPPAPGSAKDRIEVHGADTTLVVPDYVEPDDGRRLVPVVAAFGGCVPAETWASLRGARR